jgi:excisionase family DNA binding protein
MMYNKRCCDLKIAVVIQKKRYHGTNIGNLLFELTGVSAELADEPASAAISTSADALARMVETSNSSELDSSGALLVGKGEYQMTNEGKWYNRKQAAEKLQCSPSTVYRAQRDGELESSRVRGRLVRYSDDAIEEYMQRQKQKKPTSRKLEGPVEKKPKSGG